MIKFLIYKYQSHRDNVNTYQFNTNNEDDNLNQTTSNHTSQVEEVTNQEKMIFANYVSIFHILYEYITIAKREINA